MTYADPALTLHHEGAGPPVLLLHPLGVDRSVWQSVVPGLEGFTVLTCDLPGHGETPALERPMLVDEVADRVASMLEGSEPVHVVGVSLGGVVALSLAARHPLLVERLVVVDAVDVYPPAMKQMWVDRARLVRSVGLEPVIASTVELWFTSSAVDEGLEIVGRVRRLLRATDPEGYARSCELLATVDTGSLLTAITAPTLVVCGVDDAPAFTEAAPRLAATIADGRLAWLEHARHAGAVERPEAFAALVRSFLLEESDHA